MVSSSCDGGRPVAVPLAPGYRARAMTDVKAEITANVRQVRTEVGATVGEGDELVILESMKMEIPVTAPAGGTVTAVRVAPDDKVTEGDVVVVLDP